MAAVALNRETLANVAGFWRQLEVGQLSVTELSHAASLVMRGCAAGVQVYVDALHMRGRRAHPSALRPGPRPRRARPRGR